MTAKTVTINQLIAEYDFYNGTDLVAELGEMKQPVAA